MQNKYKEEQGAQRFGYEGALCEFLSVQIVCDVALSWKGKAVIILFCCQIHCIDQKT